MIYLESPPIIVLGAERSGTSVVSEMVHRWGAYAGPSEKLHKADAHAPRGYWEFLPLEFLNIQEALLKTYRELEHR